MTPLKGTHGTVRMDDGTVRPTVTESEPWLLGGHTWVVMLKGIKGCYILSRFTPYRAALRGERGVVMCESCDGKGKRWYGIQTAKHQEPADYDREYLECDECGGTGKINPPPSGE